MKTITVRGRVGCAGLWGTLGPGQVRTLDADIAESLLRGGLAEEVEPDQPNEGNATSPNASMPDQPSGAPSADPLPADSPRRKSRRANAS